MEKRALLIIIAILSLVILVGAGVYAYNKVIEKGYIMGFKEADIILYKTIKGSLDQQGFYVFNYYINESSYVPVKLTP